LKRKVIKNYELLSTDLKKLVRQTYPKGFSSSIISFFSPDGKLFNGFLLETEEIIYMVRVNKVKPVKKVETGEKDELEQRDPEDENRYIVENDQIELPDE
jgi:hypothetical protein